MLLSITCVFFLNIGYLSIILNKGMKFKFIVMLHNKTNVFFVGQDALLKKYLILKFEGIVLWGICCK